ncbi:hypothetical protein KIS1582_1106 [Cytobacillus firmus]|uniref:Uncharacterized protein n=1 Tax=Cytobacillus firmus TaxID=1399 RepID=A0A800NDT8_CYTFI|nr:hypothetical protein KIS1582_1106 [Cytobacillus firmus]
MHYFSDKNKNPLLKKEEGSIYQWSSSYLSSNACWIWHGTLLSAAEVS